MTSATGVATTPIAGTIPVPVPTPMQTPMQIPISMPVLPPAPTLPTGPTSSIPIPTPVSAPARTPSTPQAAPNNPASISAPLAPAQIVSAARPPTVPSAHGAQAAVEPAGVHAADGVTNPISNGVNPHGGNPSGLANNSNPSNPTVPVLNQSIPEKLTSIARQPRVIVKSADMPHDMQRKAIELALVALERFDLERDMAHYLKKEFDERFQPSWHCIVGRHFGSYVTHDGSGFLYFYIEKTAVLLFRSGS